MGEPRDKKNPKLGVSRGEIFVETSMPSAHPAELYWDHPAISVRKNGRVVTDGKCRVEIDDRVEVEVESTPSGINYVVSVAKDRMSATLTVQSQQGVSRELNDQSANPILHLTVTEELQAPVVPSKTDALSSLAAHKVSYGIDELKVEEALSKLGQPIVVAHGKERVPGTPGSIEKLIAFDDKAQSGVPENTPLIVRKERIDGVPGRDVTGRELSVMRVKDAIIKVGDNVALGEDKRTYYATKAGQPKLDESGCLSVLDELILEEINASTGDIIFLGSVTVRGSVGGGRKVSAGHRLTVHGNVDRAHLFSGSDMAISGSVMSSSLTAGGKKAVLASVADQALSLPEQLTRAIVNTKQLIDHDHARGGSISFALALQMILEHRQPNLISTLFRIADSLRGKDSVDEERRAIIRWADTLRTAANRRLTIEVFQQINSEINDFVSEIRLALADRSNLSVSNTQSSLIEATGELTISGRGLFNTNITAWRGIAANDETATIRGGSITTQSDVRVNEIGSPSGSLTQVRMSPESQLEAGLVYSGTVVSMGSRVFRFNADRSHVKLRYLNGDIQVESLSA